MASLDVLALLPILVWIAVALETANKIAVANCPSMPQQLSTLPVSIDSTVPDVRVSAPKAGATEPVTLSPVLIPEVQPARGKGEGALFRCGPGEEERQYRGSSCRLECQSSSSGCCTCSFESDFALPTALSPRPRCHQLSPFFHPHSLSPHSPAISLSQVDTQVDSAPLSFWGSDSEGVYGDEDTLFIAPDVFILYSEGSERIAYCGI